MSQYRCIDCDLDICKFCIHEHRLFKHLTGRQSNIIKIETGNIGVNLTSEKSCIDHKDETMQMYCTTCDSAICVSCVCDKHKKHTTMTLAKKFQEAHKLVQSDYDKTMLDMKEVKSALTKLHELEKNGDKSADDAIDLIQDHTQNIIAEVQKLADSKIEKIRSERGQHLKEIHDYEKDLSTYLEQLHRGSTFLGDLQDEDMCIELLTAIRKYKGVLESTEKSVTNKSIKQNNFTFTPGKISNKLGTMWIREGQLTNDEDETIFMQREQPTNGILGKVKKRFSVSGFLSVITFICVLIGLVKFFLHMKDEGPSAENLLQTGLYLYVCISGVFAYRKSVYYYRNT
ncbi:hypothetical protein ACF0H5_018436 [Mactra antiquata]